MIRSVRTLPVAACAAFVALGAPSFAAHAATTDGTTGVCQGFYAPGFALTAGQVTIPWPTTSQPERSLAQKEATFNTCEIRVTDFQLDGLVGFARNDYSRRQAFNANSSKQLIYSYNGSWHLYRSKDGEYIKKLEYVGGDAEPQWDPVDPTALYYLPPNGVGMKLNKLNVPTNTTTVQADFSSRLRARWPSAAAAWTRSEGSPSADGRYWCFLVHDALWNSLGFFTWDKQTDTILAMRDDRTKPDSVSMSPTGNYCVVTGSDSSQNTVAWTRDLTSSKIVRKGAEHADIALDANGDDAYVSIDYDNGYVFYVNLRTGARTDLFPTYLDGTATAFHFSGKAFDKKGWFVMSTHGEYASYGTYKQQWLHRKVMAVQLAPNPKIYNLANTRVNYQGYWTEPQASPNRTMTKVAFTSNWDVATDLAVDTYQIQIPNSAIK